MKLAAATAGLFSVLASAQGGPSENSVSCPFNNTLGPNVMIAAVKLPDNTSEINAWVFGYNWCSKSNKISSGGDICSDNGVNRTVEFMHIPLSNKFGTFDWDCYANVDINFHGCQRDVNDEWDYSNVTASIAAKDGGAKYEYQCVDDREHHACVYNGQLATPSEVSYTAFMSCGILAEP
ncbi:hypothetical protein Slin15195_G036710 [Septoria linicola]|uniref:Uncharacterized protein n=1 Tax=Septoria linicola TaxID=215465 RepID=A0A9Q9AQQ8_9PEZI|nr:hypothetical protein Slin14017_G118140 [Septoria linicola]USW50352.1 hypothetical protein Slin15195_G036710 [Septoria linicola]